MERFFLKKIYTGADGDGLRDDFVAYLEDAILSRRWSAMSDHELYLQGARRAIEEIIEELRNV